MDKIIIKNLEFFAYHGVNPEEKENGQKFVMDITCRLDLSMPCESDNVEDTVSYAKIIKAARRIFLQQKDDLLEKAAQRLCDGILSEFEAVNEITILLKKPDAPIKADFDYVAVEICRKREKDIENKCVSENKKAVISIGTNMGDREKNINDAVLSLEKMPMTKVLKVSSVIETEPWGLTEQPNFLNCAVIVETGLSPNALLGGCLGIEAAMGRERTIKYGPRVIDLDIITYEGVKSNTQELRLPHPLAKERDFVLIPLKELGVDVNDL